MPSNFRRLSLTRCAQCGSDPEAHIGSSDSGCTWAISTEASLYKSVLLNYNWTGQLVSFAAPTDRGVVIVAIQQLGTFSWATFLKVDDNLAIRTRRPASPILTNLAIRTRRPASPILSVPSRLAASPTGRPRG